MLRLLLFSALGFITVAPQAEARPIREVQHFMYYYISRISDAQKELPMEFRDGESFSQSSPQSGFVFNNFRLRIKGSVGFDVGTIFKITLVPQIELKWE